MTDHPTLLSANEVSERMRAGAAVLVDIREPEEFAARHIRGAVSRPLSGLEPSDIAADVGAGGHRPVIFTCRTGMRTGANAQRLGACAPGPAFILEGGLDAWLAAGLPVD